jgi:F-type H+-transporting ATPase subunit a
LYLGAQVAASILPNVPQPPIQAEGDFNVGGFIITNSMMSSLLVVGVFVLFCVVAGRRQERRPGKFQNRMEWAVSFMRNFAVDSAGETGRRLFPLFGALLLYLLTCNLVALIPGVGQVFVSNDKETWPFFRAVNADYNATLALALMTFTLIHVSGFRARGISHLTTYVNLPGLFDAVFRRKPMGLLDLIVGLFEAIGEFAKIISLSVRLFANIYGGEMLIAIVISLFAPLAAIFIGLELVVVAGIQAFIFGLLTIIYVSLVTSHGDEEASHA